MLSKVDRVGIIDLGSNTFHLLIVDVNNSGTFDVVHKERCFVGLAEHGIENLSQIAIDKGLQTLASFKKTLVDYEVVQYKVTGTAALRSAKNSHVFLDGARENLGLEIEVIHGKREAELIFKGVSLIYSMEGNHLIMDIGGGSVEFILVQNGINSWSKSSNIGVGVLHSEFHNSDPISQVELTRLKDFLKRELHDLNSIIKDQKIETLVGASGSFEVVETMNGNTISANKISNVSLEEYRKVSSAIIASSVAERNQMNGLPGSRVKLIVVAMILIDVVLEMIRPEKILISPYALKEGLLSELYP